MEEIKDSLNIALEIINTLLQNKEIKKSENTELYQQYVGNDEVESLCDMISEKMGFNIYRLDNTLNLCVMLDNKVFGYSNEDLKKKIKIFEMGGLSLTVRFCMPLAGGQRLKKIGFRDKFGIYRNLF